MTDEAPQTAPQILKEAANTIATRGAERDKGQERSMGATVEMFRAATGHSVTETQGWLFMALLKVARSQGGTVKLDDFLDGAAYMALAGESALKGDQA
tara:strand:- start:25471 stop:25764 length:294 start_codon:yes stop_codon:yes gene_type:complete